jgi:gas vesicle protein GvpN
MSNPSRPAAAPDVPARQVSIAPSASFVLSPVLQRLVRRATSYLRAGYSVHLRGPAGTGKTTLALHLAHLRGRPVVLVHGDDDLSSGDLVGRDRGYRRTQVVDNFVRSVVKTRETVDAIWSDSRLTVACQEGATLVYDEFTRSRPETNNALLSILEERVLNLPRPRASGASHVDVHPEFRAVCTSNSEEYAGVHRTQDALLDRLVTLPVDHHDRATEIAIARAKSGVSAGDAARIVDVVRDVRAAGVASPGPSLRACIIIARVCSQEGIRPRSGNARFRDLCQDVLGGGAVLDEMLTRGLARPAPLEAQA